MIYYLTEILKDKIIYGEQISNLFSYISFRSALAVIFSLIITTYFGKSIITFLQKKSAIMGSWRNHSRALIDDGSINLV